jgi:hypothetical protein
MRLELQHMLSEAATPDVDPSPNKSTGINVLEELLKKLYLFLKQILNLLQLLKTKEDLLERILLMPLLTLLLLQKSIIKLMKSTRTR